MGLITRVFGAWQLGVEDASSGSDFCKEFQVWQMARGKLEERPDPFLSPYFPTVEEPEGGKDA
jgi:hypothetical protein